MFSRQKPRRLRAFQPTAAQLETRVVLSGFKFPPALGPVQTLGHSGNHVLTSRAYGEVMRAIDKSLKAFSSQFARAFEQTKGNYDKLDTLLGSQNATGADGYPKGLLGQIDRIMAKAENRIPYGRGRHPGVSGGVGLSERTAGTSETNAFGRSVAGMLDDAVSSTGGLTTVKEVRRAIETVRQDVLNMVGKAKLATHTNLDGEPQGILASYISAYGPGGAKKFGLKNT